MTDELSITPFVAPLKALQQLLAHFDDQGMIIGGLAVSVLGKPRLTADVDALLLVDIEEIPHVLEVAQQMGLTPRIPDALTFARQHRVLLLQHEESGINIDISLGLLPFEIEAVNRSHLHLIGSLPIRLPTPEDLIIFKAVAHCPKDLLDIQAVVDCHPDLDKAYISDRVREFAQLLEMPEMWDDLAAILGINPSRGRGSRAKNSYLS